MPDTQLYTDQAAVKKGTVVKTSLATSKLRLCKSLVSLTRFTTKETLVAAECNYSGYPAGGIPLAAWIGPSLDPNGGSVISSPTVYPLIVPPEDDPVVPNTIYAWWVEDSTGAVRLAGTYDPPRPLTTELDSFPILLQIVEARNPTPTGGL